MAIENYLYDCLRNSYVPCYFTITNLMGKLFNMQELAGMEKNMCEKDEDGTRNVPSLVDLCVQIAIDNVDCLGDVGEIDGKLLERILPHCSVEQLQYVEDSTQVRESSLRVGQLL